MAGISLCLGAPRCWGRQEEATKQVGGGRQEALLLALALVLLATINAAVVWPLATKALQCGKSGGFCAASSLPRSACARARAPTRHALPSICWSSPTPAMDTSIDVGCAGCGVTATAAQAVIEGTSRNVVRFSCSSTCSSYNTSLAPAPALALALARGWSWPFACRAAAA